MKRVGMLALCLIMVISCVVLPASALETNDSADTPVVTRAVMYWDYTTTIPYFDFDEIPEYIDVTQSRTVGGIVYEYTGRCFLQSVEKVSYNQWNATYKGTLATYY